MMNRRARLYITGVIAAGAVAMAAALTEWRCPNPTAYLTYVVLILAASAIKMRLPGTRGTYSFGSLGGLFGIIVFTLPETLVAGCAAVLMQSVFRARTRPKPEQVAFNMGSIVLTIALSSAAWRVLSAAAVGAYPAAALAITACIYYVSSTLMVSVVLALVDNRPLGSIWQAWYLWSFPYYLIGTVLVGLLPIAGHAFSPESLLILLPALYLVHFYCGLAHASALSPTGPDGSGHLPAGARLYISGVVTAGIILAFVGAREFGPVDIRFLAYLAIAVVASLLKVKLPGMRGTISLNFVVLLVAISDLPFGQAILISAVAAAAQSCWRTTRRPTTPQVVFNTCSLVISAAMSYAVCNVILARASATSSTVLLAGGAATLYLVNTALVSGVLSLINREPLTTIWRRCYFWCLPYYLIGTAAAGIVIVTGRSNGWAPSLLVFPVLALVYVSFYLHVSHSSDRSVATT